MDEKTVKILEAIDLLRENDYAVIKLSECQLSDSKKCEESGFEKDCSECSCSACVVQ